MAVFSGFLIGALSGLLPGLHSNTIASLAAAGSPDASFLSFFIMAVFASHIAFSFFPAIFIGAPDENTVQSVLPGHRLMREGKGLVALLHVCACLCIAAMLSLLLFPLALQLMPLIYSAISPHMLLFLLAASAFLLISERSIGKIAKASLVFLLCGFLGSLTMQTGMREPLFCVFSGLFAVSGLISSQGSSEKIPTQQPPALSFSSWKYVLVGIALGMLSDLFPGIAAPAQIAVFASFFIKIEDAMHYLALVSSIAASHAVFALSAAIGFGKAREGSLAIVQQTAGISMQNAGALLGTFALCLGLSALLIVLLLRFAHKIDFNIFSRLRIPIVMYLFAVSFILDGALGVFVLALSSLLGTLPLLLGVRRTHVMGCIIVPSMLLLA
ncbi:tripartite tricarboxylate transporter permease [Candidatus Micrarchaeota archaeon]|nr:tripartite tricarboxylate transporter permease [Candidatus Micrarchaeota archaeon]